MILLTLLITPLVGILVILTNIFSWSDLKTRQRINRSIILLTILLLITIIGFYHVTTIKFFLESLDISNSYLLARLFITPLTYIMVRNLFGKNPSLLDIITRIIFTISFCMIGEFFLLFTHFYENESFINYIASNLCVLSMMFGMEFALSSGNYNNQGSLISLPDYIKFFYDNPESNQRSNRGGSQRDYSGPGGRNLLNTPEPGPEPESERESAQGGWLRILLNSPRPEPRVAPPSSSQAESLPLTRNGRNILNTPEPPSTPLLTLWDHLINQRRQESNLTPLPRSTAESAPLVTAESTSVYSAVSDSVRSSRSGSSTSIVMDLIPPSSEVDIESARTSRAVSVAEPTSVVSPTPVVGPASVVGSAPAVAPVPRIPLPIILGPSSSYELLPASQAANVPSQLAVPAPGTSRYQFGPVLMQKVRELGGDPRWESDVDPRLRRLCNKYTVEERGKIVEGILPAIVAITDNPGGNGTATLRQLPDSIEKSAFLSMLKNPNTTGLDMKLNAIKVVEKAGLNYNSFAAWQQRHVEVIGNKRPDYPGNPRSAN